MLWIKSEEQEIPEFKDLLVIKQYRDAPYGENGYENEKSFWTNPIIMIDTWLGKSNGWNKGGRVTHWMHLPELPKERL